MNRPAPNITVNVDVTNPGQFFACCGLLELADRLWPGAEGWFEGTAFCIATKGTLHDLAGELVRADICSSLSTTELRRLASLLSQEKATLTPHDREEKARLQERWRLESLHVSKPFGIWLDWWRDCRGDRTALKTWAAKQLVADMARRMYSIVREHAVAEITHNANPFFETDDPSLPFNFDSDLSKTGNAREAGFSSDTLGTKCSYKPLLELLAFIALQRFHPRVSGERFVYCTWTTRMSPEVACVAASGTIARPHEQQFEFGLFNRTKYMKAFLPSMRRSQGA